MTRVSEDSRGTDEHPRDSEGKFTFKTSVHEVAVKDKKGKHLHSIKRCANCGTIFGKKAGHHGRVKCPTCGQDGERKLEAVSKIVLASSESDAMAKQMGWGFLGKNNQGHRRYYWDDPTGVHHVVLVGSGRHKHGDHIDAQFARQRMNKCLEGKCGHVFVPEGVDPIGEPGEPVFAKGQTIKTGGHFGLILETNGEASLVQNFETSQKGWVPNQNLQAVSANEPDWLYVYYMSELMVRPYQVNLRHQDMLKELLDEFGVDLNGTFHQIDQAKVDAGEIWKDGDDIAVRHTQLSEPEVREYAERAIHNWWVDQPNGGSKEVEWATLPSDDSSSQQ